MADGQQIDLDQDPRNIQAQLFAAGLQTLKKLQGQQLEEAAQAGAPLEVLGQQLKQQEQAPIQQQAQQQIAQQAPGQALAGQQVQQAAPQQQVAQQTARRNPLQMLSSLVQGVVDIIPTSPAAKTANVQAALGQQRLRGEVPLQQGELEKIAFKQARDLDKEGRLDANQIFTKFEPVANKFQIIVDQFQRVQTAAEDPSAAGDLAMIFAFMKMLDPTSAVLPGEQATAENAGGVEDKLRNFYNKIRLGTKLSDRQRSDFLDRSKRLFKNEEGSFKQNRGRFAKLAKRNKLDPTRVLRDVGLVEQTTQAEQTNQFADISDEELRRIAGGQ